MINTRENNTKGKVKFVTLGCRVNQYDTQAMREAMLSVGYQQAGRDNRMGAEAVDVVVINTCTVTAEADKESRYWMRRAKKMYPNARVVVTGCGVTRNKKEIEALPEVDIVVENHDKADLPLILSSSCANPEFQDSAAGSELIRRKKQKFTPLEISKSEGSGRAFIKIQDGCNHACSFCKVVLARGRSRSRELSDILDEVKRLRDSGYREVVFAGIQLGAYGWDLPVKRQLEDVIEAAAAVEGVDRIRLSSIEPTDVRPELIRVMLSISKCVPHLHIPLQSGDTTVLQAMNRRYTREFYIELIEQLRGSFSDFALSVDVMAGFPTESEKSFMNTMDLLERVRPVKTHVFPYSLREGTKAAALDELPWPVVQNRVNQLIQHGENLARSYKEAYLGRVMPILTESVRAKYGADKKQSGEDGAWLQGLTVNFMKVCFYASAKFVSRIIPVKLEKIEGEYIVGKAVESI